MKQFFTLLALCALSSLSAQAIVDFEAVAIDSFLNGSDRNGGFDVGNLRFPNFYGETEGISYWSGWSLSNTTDTITPGITNQYSSITGGGAGGSDNYAVAFGSGRILLNEASRGATLGELMMTNTTYTALSMRDGDGFARRYGGVTGDEPDFLSVTFKGHHDGTVSPDSVTIYLADYRFEDNSQDYIVTEWTPVDLSTLGPVDSVSYYFASTVTNEFGILTPAYFAIDNITNPTLTSVNDATLGAALRIYPNPTAGHLRIEGIEASGTIARVYDMQGRQLITQDLLAAGRELRLQHLPAGTYVLQVQRGGGSYSLVVLRR